jgi:hypothetical protein
VSNNGGKKRRICTKTWPNVDEDKSDMDRMQPDGGTEETEKMIDYGMENTHKQARTLQILTSYLFKASSFSLFL